MQLVKSKQQNIAAKLEYERMSNNHIKFLPKLMISYFSLTINISSIKKLVLGALCDQHLVGSYFHFLTETQLQWHNDLDQIKSIFKEQFKIEINLNDDKYESMIRYKDNISIINHVK